jgi:hypothetical protein
MSDILSRDAAWALLTEWTTSESLRKHAMAVEAAVRGYARTFGANEDDWGLVGLLHDFDYERYPTPADHPFRGCDELRRRGYPEWVMRAILSHAPVLRCPARESAGEIAVCLRRDGRLRDRGIARAPEQERARSRSLVGDQADEGQGVRQGRVPRRSASGRRGA